MSYRLLEITALYKKYIDYFYSKNSKIDDYSYDQLYNLLIGDCFAECDFIHSELQKLGNETKLVFYNDERIQKKWRPEFKDSSLFEILCEQVKAFNPDVIYISDIGLLDCNELKILRSVLSKNVKLVGWHFSVVSIYKDVLKCFDQIYTGSKYILSLLEPYCKNVKLLYHGFSSRILDNVSKIERENKIVFPGSIMIGEEIHNNRIDMLGQLYKQNIPFDFYGHVYGSFLPHSVKETIKWLIHPSKISIERIKTEKRLVEDIKDSVFGMDYYNVLNSYSICVNQHAEIAGTGSGNMRLFEATGMGICLLTDYRKENTDLFIPDEEIVEYRSYDELIDKAQYLINNPEVAIDIGKKGQRRTLETHSYRDKALKMDSYIKEIL